MKKMTIKRSNKTVSMMAITAIILALLFSFPASGICAMKAVVSTVAATWDSGAHSVIDTEPVGGARSAQNNLLPTPTTDITVAAYGHFFYRIERFQADSVTKFDINAPETPIWQFSTMDDTDTATSNPYDMIFVSDQKAYLLRYGSARAWIVNPSAITQADFKIGELDLSAYDDGDGIPEMSSAVIANGKLFIAMQRLDRDDGFSPTNDVYVAVFDTATDREIATGTDNPDNVMGIVLPIRNIGSIQYLAANNTIYIQGAGGYESSWSGRAADYSGGIMAIDPNSYSVSQILDDGDSENHPYGNISGMGIVSPEKGYFVGYAGYGDNALYMFNPTTGSVLGVANDELTGKNIAGMEAGAFTDGNNMLWVCNGTDAEVVILNTTDNSIDERVATNLNPTKVVFVDDAQSSEMPCAQIAGNLDISIGSAKFDSLNLSADFEFIGDMESSNLIWKLKTVKVLGGDVASSTVIADNLDITINCAALAGQMYRLTMAYNGSDKHGDHLWRFTGLEPK